MTTIGLAATGLWSIATELAGTFTLHPYIFGFLTFFLVASIRDKEEGQEAEDVGAQRERPRELGRNGPEPGRGKADGRHALTLRKSPVFFKNGPGVTGAVC